MADDFETTSASFCQDVAARRHIWVSNDRDAYRYLLRYEDRDAAQGRANCIASVILWGDEHAYYARAAMAWMGLTDEDQFYA